VSVLKQIMLKPSERSEMGRAVMLGLNFGVGMAVFSCAGFYIDQWRGRGGMFFTVCGMLAGLGYGAYEVWMVIRMLNAQARRAVETSRKVGTDRRSPQGNEEQGA